MVNFSSVVYLCLLGIAVALWRFSSSSCAPWLHCSIHAEPALLLTSSFALFPLRGTVALLGCWLLSEEPHTVVSGTPHRRVRTLTDPLRGAACMGWEDAVLLSSCQMNAVPPPGLSQAFLVCVSAVSATAIVLRPKSVLQYNNRWTSGWQDWLLGH